MRFSRLNILTRSTMKTAVVTVQILFFIQGIINTSSNIHFGCTTPDRNPGICTPIDQCPHFHSMIQNASDVTSTLLKQSICGYDGKKPRLCCPTSSQVVEYPYWNHDLLPNYDVCGYHIEYKIIWGIQAHVGQYPWNALFEYQMGGLRHAFCGGVLISKRYILTAAHCIQGKDIPEAAKLFQVRLGSNVIDDSVDSAIDKVVDDFDGPPALNFSVEEVIVHEGYNYKDSNSLNDLALVRLAAEVTYSENISPICLPSPKMSVNDPSKRFGLAVAGWGASNNDTFNSRNKFHGMVFRQANSSICEAEFNVTLKDGQFCTTANNNTQLSCAIDDGGSVMGKTLTPELHYFISGVLTAKPKNCSRDPPSIFTTLDDDYVRWIISKLRA